MKKSIALVALAFGVTTAFAQDLTSKKGEPILPEAEDWAIGIDATPFLTYAQSIFGKTSGTAAPSWSYFTNNNTITGKMFKDAKTAYRGSLRLGFGGTGTQNNVVSDRTAPVTAVFPATYPTKTNKWTNNATNVALAVGMEKRRGKTRLQGIYGAEFGISFSSTRDKFAYGNSLNPVSTSSSTPVVDPNGNGNEDGFAGYGGGSNVLSTAAAASSAGIIGATAGGARLLDNKSGLTVAFGLRAFIGAEYFFMPKMSLGGEFGWGIAFSTTGASTKVYESNGNTGSGANISGQTTVKGGTKSSFLLDNSAAGNSGLWGASGSIKLNMYF